MLHRWTPYAILSRVFGHYCSDIYGGMPVMFTQVVVFSSMVALQAEYDQRPLFLSPYTCAKGHVYSLFARSNAWCNAKVTVTVYRMEVSDTKMATVHLEQQQRLLLISVIIWIGSKI